VLNTINPSTFDTSTVEDDPSYYPKVCYVGTDCTDPANVIPNQPNVLTPLTETIVISQQINTIGSVYMGAINNIQGEPNSVITTELTYDVNFDYTYNDFEPTNDADAVCTDLDNTTPCSDGVTTNTAAIKSGALNDFEYVGYGEYKIIATDGPEVAYASGADYTFGTPLYIWSEYDSVTQAYGLGDSVGELQMVDVVTMTAMDGGTYPNAAFNYYLTVNIDAATTAN
jgi:hypothetical protein